MEPCLSRPHHCSHLKIKLSSNLVVSENHPVQHVMFEKTRVGAVGLCRVGNELGLQVWVDE